MKKLSLLLIIILAGFSFSGCTDKDTPATNTAVVQNEVAALPARPAEVNGSIRSIEGNEIVIANELKKALSEEDQAAKKAERQNMTQEEKQALRQEEQAKVETETLTLTIPVGVTIVKTSGAGDGATVNAELSEIKSGLYVSLWINNDEVEAVKLKGTN